MIYRLNAKSNDNCGIAAMAGNYTLPPEKDVIAICQDCKHERIVFKTPETWEKFVEKCEDIACDKCFSGRVKLTKSDDAE